MRLFPLQNWQQLTRIANQKKERKEMKALKNCTENVIEFLKDEKRATVTFSQGKYRNRIQKLAKEYPEKCQIVAKNRDGSICARIPVAWVKISPPAARSEIQKEHARERMRNLNSKHVSVTREEG